MEYPLHKVHGILFSAADYLNITAHVLHRSPKTRAKAKKSERGEGSCFMTCILQSKIGAPNNFRDTQQVQPFVHIAFPNGKWWR